MLMVLIFLGEAFNADVKSRNQTKISGTTKESANYRNIIENNFERKVNFIKYIDAL